MHGTESNYPTPFGGLDCLALVEFRNWIAIYSGIRRDWAWRSADEDRARHGIRALGTLTRIFSENLFVRRQYNSSWPIAARS
jgi:hypothetical protein